MIVAVIVVVAVAVIVVETSATYQPSHQRTNWIDRAKESIVRVVEMLTKVGR